MSRLLWPLISCSLLYCFHLVACEPLKGLHLDTGRVAQAGLPRDHPELTEPGVLGLPTGCLTYAERYARAKNFTQRREKGWSPNAEHPDSQYVVLVRVHNGLPYPADLLQHLLSLMEEVGEVGMHFWLLYQEDRPPGKPGSLDIPKEAAYMDLAIPNELVPVHFAYSQHQIHEAYPRVHSYEPHFRDYLPTLHFFNRHKQYRFGWVMEWDLRYTGIHWGEFLNSALHLASSQLFDATPSAQEQKSIGRNYSLSSAEQILPDLIAFTKDAWYGPIHYESWGPDDPPWVPRDGEFWNFTNLTKVGLMEMGLSRRLMDRLHDLSVKGVAGYLEEFVPTACEPDLAFVTVPMAQYGGISHQCCATAAKGIYQNWYKSGNCLAHALLHPVKLFAMEENTTLPSANPITVSRR